MEVTKVPKKIVTVIEPKRSMTVDKEKYRQKDLELTRAREHHETEVINRGVKPKSDLCLWGASPQQATGRFPVTEISLFIKFV